ncbi:1-acyl-sn-glycerol-3-phosphate acyltransferase [Candidatus Promineifilum breve]|uniref:1-acyl-sn-glycerol-3-phosphate acyltransferase n=1 Tax=Candidatus Promineifilum breve TaxID=1806508 RepID=A0A160T2K6_9CHLR|nr:lysophospholipid acyltransferase family protein [Candidatus Promineifilum breve]CUS03924.2 1-acyl-sn-glycerol-3-phosphate acyltransferase [Candidatus Promineifilum breve]
MSKHTFLRLIRAIARVVLGIIARIEIIGSLDFQNSGFIIAGNHVGRLEAFLVMLLANRDDIILILAEKYKQYAFWRYVARKVDAIWINRFEADFAALRVVLKRLEQGEVMAVAPEGTRSPTEALLPGRPGAVYLAAKSGLPLIPIGVTGTEDRVVKYRLKRLQRLDITARIGQPFHLPPMPRAGRDEWLQAQTDELMCRIAALLPPSHRGVYADHPRLIELLREQGSPFAEDKHLLAA